VNPYILLALVAAWLGSGAAAYHYGGKHKADEIEAGLARDERVTILASEAARLSTAEAIATIEVKNTTIRQTLEKEVHEKTVYRDCRSSDDAVRLLNSSTAVAKPGPVAASGVELPASGPAR
jgi:hypothetical protein